jgi:hypothetical protein
VARPRRRQEIALEGCRDRGRKDEKDMREGQNQQRRSSPLNKGETMEASERERQKSSDGYETRES